MTSSSDRPSGGMVPLASLADGTRARLVTVEGGTGLRSRLMAMGLREGTRIRVVQNGGRGPFVLATGEARIVLGRGMAYRVMVDPTDEPAGADDRPRDAEKTHTD